MIQTGVIQGLEKAISRYEKKGTNFFALYCGNDKFPVVNGLNGRWEDMSECVDELKEYFEDITPDHKKIYSIVWYEGPVKPDTKGKISDIPEGSVKFITSNPEQIQTYIQDYRERQTQYVGSINNEIVSTLAAMQQVNNEILRKISEEDEDEEPGQPQNALAGLVQDPNVVNFLVGTVQTIIDRILPPKQHIAGIAGLENSSKLDQAIDILRKHDDQLEDDLMILANMAENNPFQFKMLLNMLRK